MSRRSAESVYLCAVPWDEKTDPLQVGARSFREAAESAAEEWWGVGADAEEIGPETRTVTVIAEDGEGRTFRVAIERAVYFKVTKAPV